MNAFRTKIDELLTDFVSQILKQIWILQKLPEVSEVFLDKMKIHLPLLIKQFVE